MKTTISLITTLFLIQTAQANPKTSVAPTIPKLKNGEYALLVDDTYQVFRTTTFQKLELSQNCFKAAKPKCIAYSVSLEKVSPVKLANSDANNFAAHNCVNVGGKNLIALDHEHNEYNFCRFSDGSMVTSWSMYYKTNPAQTTK